MAKAKARPGLPLVDWLGPLVILVAMAAALAVISPHFLRPGNLSAVAVQTSCVAILAVAETLVIIAGGIDLAVGSVLALAGVSAAVLMSGGMPIPLACLAGLACGLACGLASGVLVAFGRMPPFIATLGVMGIARGASLITTGGENVTALPPAFSDLAVATWLGVPLPALLALTVAIGAHVMLTRTALGRNTYAVGGNAEAARLSGVPLRRVLITLFALSGALSGIAGLMLTSRLSIGQPTAGLGYELDAIAGAVIGGTSLMGGQGSIQGAILGAAIMGLLRNGCNLMRVPDFWQQVAIGAIIIGAVFCDQFRRRR